MRKRELGFTLIELLVVIGILAVLLAIVLIAINPARQFAQANNAKRSSDVNALLNAIHQYSADNRGNLAGLADGGGDSLPAVATEITGTFNELCSALVPTYIAALPVDPLVNNGDPVEEAECGDGTATWATGYTVAQSATDARITVCAPRTELGVSPICVLR